MVLVEEEMVENFQIILEPLQEQTTLVVVVEVEILVLLVEMVEQACA